MPPDPLTRGFTPEPHWKQSTQTPLSAHALRSPYGHPFQTYAEDHFNNDAQLDLNDRCVYYPQAPLADPTPVSPQFDNHNKLHNLINFLTNWQIRDFRRRGHFGAK